MDGEVTRTCSSWICAHLLEPGGLDGLHDLLPLVGGDPLHQGHGLPHLAAERLLGLAVVQVADGDAPLDELALDDVHQRLEPVVVVGQQLERAVLLAEVDLRRGGLEVVALPDLLERLVHGVVDLLQVHGRGDVEGGVLGHCVGPLRVG
ncbi:MAG TPA: hypothetical protein VEW03_07020 [Longimicrobiaceae bacterium]|nr:hypothetical protein [Longimicrobiaceae bacterium]